jgi:glyoxylase-like metal-dependent hydrolase (beta-lactamase superfamily II)
MTAGPETYQLRSKQLFDWRDYGNGIIAFDSGYVRPMLASIHMIVENNHVAFIDTGTNESLPNALAALNKIGVAVTAVDYVILTHIHLDHAGGAGAMMQNFPNAKLVVHPRGARHMTEPSKLVAGVTAVYGSEYVQRVYGEIVPVSPERIIAAVDGHVVTLAGRKLTCLDTPGHARHHICIVDDQTGGIFTGDTFGLSYRELDVDGRQFVFPTTTPSQFDPEAMRESMGRLMEFSPPVMYLTHYGQLYDVAQRGLDLRRRLIAVVELAVAESRSGDARHGRIKKAMMKYLLSEIRDHGCSLPEKTLLDIWETDLELNSQGLVLWLDSAV